MGDRERPTLVEITHDVGLIWTTFNEKFDNQLYMISLSFMAVCMINEHYTPLYISGYDS